MRCVQDKHYAYIFNAWSDGKFRFRNNNEGLTFEAMMEAGKTKPDIQARVDMFRHRVPQEFYDLEKDPSCTVNLIHDPQYQALVKNYQDRLRQWMVETHDHNLVAFDVREDPAKLAKAMSNYPKLTGPIASDDESADTKSETDDKAAKRKANRSAKKAEK